MIICDRIYITPMQYLIYALFALSGVAGLIYEGSWARYLKLFLGHSSYGQVLTLCIYMGGLAIGSFIAGRFVSRIKRPLRAYALTELVIGIGGILYHPVYLRFTHAFYDASWSSSFSTQTAEIVKVIIATVSTLPIAIALGMTFPFIAAGLFRRNRGGGELSLSRLYFTNSLGAAIGILAASYLLIPVFGNQATLGIAATINFLLAAVFYVIDTVLQNSEENEAEENSKPEIEIVPEVFSMPRKNTWLCIAAITGFTSFVYEVVWIRLLSLLMGSSSHSFDQMLSAFIFGLAIGSAVSGKFIKKDLLKQLAFAQIFMAFFALCTLYFHGAFWSAMNESNQIFNHTAAGYVGWSLFKYVISVFWMVPTSFFAGMTLPLITLILTRAFRSEAPIGRVYGWNTLGSILGSVFGGLIFIPLLQLKWTLAVAALGDLAIGFLLLVLFRKKFRHNVLFYMAILFMIAPLAVIDFDPQTITSGAFRTYKSFTPDESVTVRNGKTATISFHESKVHWYIKTNGKTDASMSKDRSLPLSGDELTQAATAFVPMAMRDKPYEAAMIGFGSGMSVHYLLSDPLLTKLDVVEIEKEMVNLAKGFLPWNSRGFNDPRINLYYDDARTFFHTQRQQYDVIVSVPSNPWVSGVSSLFSHEFYAQMKRYMKPQGLWVQWIQTYEFNDELLLNILKALDISFHYVALYKVPEAFDVIIIASDSPVEQKFIDRFHTNPILIQEFERIHRPWYYFGEQNFLFTTQMLKPVFRTVEPNSEFIPMVDNKAEEARFMKSEAKIVSAFDSCELCWPLLLDSISYAPRFEFKKRIQAMTPVDHYRTSALLNHLNDENLDWMRFWKEYREWSMSVPFDTSRDTIPLYIALKQKFEEGKISQEYALEFGMMDNALHGNTHAAGLALQEFMDNYEMVDMNPIFIRNAILIALQGKLYDDLKVIFEEAVLPRDDFSLAEKQLIERKIRARN